MTRYKVQQFDWGFRTYDSQTEEPVEGAIAEFDVNIEEVEAVIEGGQRGLDGAPGPRGPQGFTGPAGPPGSGTEVNTFETVSKNIKAWDATYGYTGDQLTTITYTDGVSTIIKTLNYTGPQLTSLVLSGDTPASIDLTKTLLYTLDKLTGAVYS